MSTDVFVKAGAIEHWANSREAQGALPHLLRRLVASTVTGLRELDFPAYESSHRSGFDGVVDCESGNAWVPDGRSAWEMGVDKSPKTKADSDFTKRSDPDNTPISVQRDAAFVFVTPRHYKFKSKWLATNRKAKTCSWRDVRFYDADNLEQWIESAPYGVRVWAGRLMGVRPQGVEDIASRWEGISLSTKHKLKPSVFVSGRQSSIERWDIWRNTNATHLSLECRSPIEVIDFVCAAITALDELDRLREESRTVIVRSPEAWEILRESTVPMVLVVSPELEVLYEEIPRALANGHHVLTATEPKSFSSESDNELERASEYELAQSLEECGYEPIEAEQQAHAAGGSLAILKQRLQKTQVQPKWAAGISSKIAATCLLLGGWKDAESDKCAFETIAGISYADMEAELQCLASCEDALLIHAASKWRLISKDFAWPLLQHFVTPNMLKRFESLAVEILADDDPRYLLPESERLMANVNGHAPVYSGTLKKHVAETLAFLGQFGMEITASSSIDVCATVDRIVATILSPTATWHRWASLGRRLSLLAEASPRVFLNSVAEDLRRSAPELGKLLHEEDDTLFGRCNHSGLLWALECLAWSRDHVSDSLSALLSLAQIDPGGRWSNRPKNSICDILSYWMPHTTLNVDERIQLLDVLLRRNGETAWGIFFELLPQPSGGMSSPTVRPYWRDWANTWTRGVSRGDSVKFITAVAKHVVCHAGTDTQRWGRIFKNIARFPYTVRDNLIERATSLTELEFSDEDRQILSDQLMEAVNRHRAFADSDWSLPTELIDQLETIAIELKPEDAVLKHLWLFEPYPDRYFTGSRDIESNEKELAKARESAMAEILKIDGFNGVDELVHRAKSPYDVGRVLAIVTRDDFVTTLIPQRLSGNERDLDFAHGFVWTRFWPDHWDWVDEKLNLCESTNQRATFFSMLPFAPAVWDRVDACCAETVDLYWQRCRASIARLDSESAVRAIGKLNQASRPVAAIDLIWMGTHKKWVMSSELIISPLELLLDLPVDIAEQQYKLLQSYHLQEVIQVLQKRNDVRLERMIRIEWSFLELLDEHLNHSPWTLFTLLAKQPEFLIELLSYCFRPRSERGKSKSNEPTSQQRKLAEQSYRLLSAWDLVPGSTSDGSVDVNALREWCEKARQLAADVDLLEVCETHIGEVFAHSPADSDGTWPCNSVCEVFEDIATDSLKSGMYCGICNSRGASFHAPGGDDEHKLALSFRQKADAIRFKWPAAASVLDSVAKSYDRERERWAEEDRWGER